MAEKQKFTIIIQEEPEGGYTGKCLELRGAISYGKTIDELKNMKEAILLVLETLAEEAQSKRKEIIEIS
jgi:predicted RNase H-like HicB family nuclease